ncbi:MAG: NapC/NirT family cytochrome c [Gammaproteobacteria bacterium]|nr:NapC/NirT family cytochrome c [Gammaproteobacteria bacterium]NNF67478.1 cytochrome C [Gammaproteobacteria bacterium]
MTDSNKKQRGGFWGKPRSKWLLGIPVGGFVAFAVGAVALGTTNYVIHETSSTEFCFVCHSHDQFIRPEYEASSHFINTAGVRAGCSDCHLPHDNWFELVWTKAVVSLDIVPELMGKLDTAEKYESHRAEMAESVWREFKGNDSKFCRSCHSIAAMDLEAQGRSTARRHSSAQEKGQTCIDCHYGIVHKAPDNASEILERIASDLE